MADRGAQAWHWPSLDRPNEPVGDFIPEDRAPDGGAGQPASEQAEQLLRDGREQAERLVEDARERAERLRIEARSEALEQARSALDATLREIAGEQTATFARAHEALLRRVEEEAADRLGRLERQLVGLVAMMTEKVIRRKVEIEDGVVLDVVRATVEQAAGADRFTVRVPPSDDEPVRRAMAELLAVADSPERMEIVADDAVGPAGCIVETERGRFDARLETQIQLLTGEIGRVTGEGEEEAG